MRNAKTWAGVNLQFYQTLEQFSHKFILVSSHLHFTTDTFHNISNYFLHILSYFQENLQLSSIDNQGMYNNELKHGKDHSSLIQLLFSIKPSPKMKSFPQTLVITTTK